MIEKGSISAFQMGKMLFLAITPTAILTAPGITYKFAKHDLWISPIWAFSGLITVFILLRLHRLYPKDTLIQASERILGRFPGKILGGAYWLFYLYLNGIIVREYGEFVNGAFMPNTPPILVLGSMVLVCAIAVRGGLEIVGRFADLILPVFFILFLLILAPILPDLHMEYMLPIMGDGILPSLEGALVLQIWYSEMLTASFLLPYVSDREHAGKSILISLAAVVLTLVVSNLATLLLLGNLAGSYTYPFLILARYINLAQFFTHLEALFMAIWVLGAFAKICVFYYVTVLGAAQWMNLSDYRPIVYPLGFLLLLFSMWVAPNYQELTHTISTSVIFSTMVMFVIIPALLLAVAWVRHRMRGSLENQ